MTASKPLVSSLEHQHSYLVHQVASKHIGTSSHEWTEAGSTRVTNSYLEMTSEKDSDILYGNLAVEKIWKISVL